ncbi:MAG: hypothetical protein HY512_00830 [Candidatus Aenigmarchaeota archaeon]|nr:hypothetical protein [Candidatus Aenigmarchaeota archaeon]
MTQIQYEQKLKSWIAENHVQAEHLHFENSVHTVEEACAQAKAQPDDFVKTICMITNDGKVIGAIVLGSDRASTTKVGEVLKIERPRTATPEEALEKTGYIVGGTPPFGYEATFLMDQKVMEKETVYAGGGTPNALIRISTKELQKANDAQVMRVRK